MARTPVARFSSAAEATNSCMHGGADGTVDGAAGDAAGGVLGHAPPGAIGRAPGNRSRKEGGEALDDRNGSRTGTTAAVGGGKGLVKVGVHDVEPHVAGANDAEDGVEVGAVVVDEPVGTVHRPGDLGDVLLEEPEGVGGGQR